VLKSPLQITLELPLVNISRADFLKNCSIALVGAFVADAAKLWSVPLQGVERNARFRLQDANAAFFRRYLNDTFSVRAAGRSRTRLVLAKVADGPVTKKNVEQFSLIFHGPAGMAIPDGTHAFRHATLGDFDLFIVANGIPNDRRVVYEACFGRHVSPAASGAT
jgi:hypothetical protein